MDTEKELYDIYSTMSPLKIGNYLKLNSKYRDYLDTKITFQTSSYTEKLFAFVNGINEPICPYCVTNRLSFRSITKGYSKSCRNRDCKIAGKDLSKFRETLKKRKQIFIQPSNYTPYTSQEVLLFVKQHLKRMDGNINSNLVVPANFIKKFGSSVYLSLFDYYLNHQKEYVSFPHYIYDLEKGPSFCYCGKKAVFANYKSGYRPTCSLKCSNNLPTKIASVIEKASSPSSIERRNLAKQIYLKEKIDSHYKKIRQEGLYNIESHHFDGELRYDFVCRKCNNMFNSTFKYRRCYTCSPKRFNKEQEIAEYFDGAQVNVKSIFDNGRIELDCFIDHLNVAIEYDGLLWHSYGKSSSSMLNNFEEEDRFSEVYKTDLCEEKGIQLFRVWSNEWEDPQKKKIWVSKFNIINGKAQKIHARKTTILEVSAKDAKDFLQENHLQGACPSKYNYGLYFEGELVSIMCIGRSRFNKQYDYELLRMCSKQNITVVGGPSKLLSYAARMLRGTMVTYANRRWSNGNVYKKLGFTYKGKTDPGYFYTKGDQVFSRQKFQKHKLKEVLEYFDPHKSEKENVFNNQYRRIWDCGNLIFTIKL